MHLVFGAFCNQTNVNIYNNHLQADKGGNFVTEFTFVIVLLLTGFFYYVLVGFLFINIVTGNCLKYIKMMKPDETIEAMFYKFEKRLRQFSAGN